MNKYIIIRSDTKSISPPMPKQEAIKRLKLYGSQGITSYIIHRDRHIDFNYIKNSNIYEG